MRATLCGDRHGPEKLGTTISDQDFLRFLICARDDLRRSEWSMLKRDPLRRSAWSKRSRCGAVRICKAPDEPSAGIVRVEALSLWRRAKMLLANWSLEVVAWVARLLALSELRLENRDF